MNFWNSSLHNCATFLINIDENSIRMQGWKDLWSVFNYFSFLQTNNITTLSNDYLRIRYTCPQQLLWIFDIPLIQHSLWPPSQHTQSTHNWHSQHCNLCSLQYVLIKDSNFVLIMSTYKICTWGRYAINWCHLTILLVHKACKDNFALGNIGCNVFFDAYYASEKTLHPKTFQKIKL